MRCSIRASATPDVAGTDDTRLLLDRGTDRAIQAHYAPRRRWLTGANVLLMTGAVVLVVLLLIGALVSLIAPSDPMTMDVVTR